MQSFRLLERVVGFVGVSMMAACASVAVSYTALNPSPYPTQPKTAESVEFFTSATPTRKYVEIGTMKAMHDSITTDEDMFRKIREEAARQGCDGVVITQRGSQEAVAACIVYSTP
jgi:hypothetical protein